jgi:hypothetical protein
MRCHAMPACYCVQLALCLLASDWLKVPKTGFLSPTAGNINIARYIVSCSEVTDQGRKEIKEGLPTIREFSFSGTRILSVRVPEPEPKEFFNSGTHLGTQTEIRQNFSVPYPNRTNFLGTCHSTTAQMAMASRKTRKKTRQCVTHSFLLYRLIIHYTDQVTIQASTAHWC